ncbi:MAG: redoxin domain-containing protein [Pyrinomonadaceae bacterium]
MNKQVLIAIVLLLGVAALLLTVIGRPLNTKNQAASSAAPATAVSEEEESAGEEETAGIRRDAFVAAARAPRAPALSQGTWINSEPLKLEALRGRVVVVDFWTFGCYNCRNTLPTLKNWDAKYRDKGLTIVGVHTPESGYEKDLGNIRRAVREQNLRYPVVTDLNGDTWRAYGIEAWPTTVIVDKQGRVRFTHIGEGMYDQMDRVIQKLLAE